MARDINQPEKRQRRKAARPAEILSAALDLWAERGFAATRLEDVAARAKIAKGTIYLYYASKQALFEAAVQTCITTVVQEQQALAAQSDLTAPILLERFIQAVSHQLIEGRAAVLIKVLISEGQRFPALVELYREMVINRGLATVEAILARAKQSGNLQPGFEELDPRLIVSPVLAMAIWHLVFAPVTVAERRILWQQHMEILRRALFRATETAE